MKVFVSMSVLQPSVNVLQLKDRCIKNDLQFFLAVLPLSLDHDSFFYTCIKE